MFAASSNLYQEGMRQGARLIKQVLESPGRAGKILQVYDSFTSNDSFLASEIKILPCQALSLIVEMQLTRAQYNVLRITMKSIG